MAISGRKMHISEIPLAAMARCLQRRKPGSKKTAKWQRRKASKHLSRKRQQIGGGETGEKLKTGVRRKHIQLALAYSAAGY